MTDHARTSLERATSLLPLRIVHLIAQDTEHRSYFVDEVLRYHAMEDAELLRVTEVCLRNLGRLDADTGADADLRYVLMPELWDRLAPNVGTRDRLRRISTSLAEYDPDRPSVFRRLLKPEQIVELGADAERLRQKIARAATDDAASLVEQVQFAIAGSSADRIWPPTTCVYEPGFTYRVAPVVARRLLERTPRTIETIETIQSAAVRYGEIVYSLPPPARHSDVFRLMTDLPGEATGVSNQGFVTSAGRFVDRREAAILARAASQLIREPTPSYLLTSEDVW